MHHGSITSGSTLEIKSPGRGTVGSTQRAFPFLGQCDATAGYTCPVTCHVYKHDSLADGNQKIVRDGDAPPKDASRFYGNSKPTAPRLLGNSWRKWRY